MAIEFENVSRYPSLSTQVSSQQNNHFHPEICSFTNYIDLITDANCYRHSLFLTITLCFLHIVIFLFGLVSNVVAIYVLGWRQGMRTITNTFILNLSVSDLLVILCCLPINLISNIFVPWIPGSVMCKVFPFIQGISVFAAIYSLVSVSVYRWRTIHRTINYTFDQSKPYVYLCIAIIWIVGAVLTMYCFSVFEINYIDSVPYCTENWDSKTFGVGYYAVVHLLIFYILPVLGIIYSNYQIWENVRHGPVPVARPRGSRVHHGPTSEEIQRKGKLRIFKLLSVLTSAFFVCWLPLHIIMGWIQFVGLSTSNQVLEFFIAMSQLLAISNSCINPVLYALWSKRFQQSLSGMWTSIQKWCCRKRERRRLARQASGRFFRAANNNNPARLNVENERRNGRCAEGRAVSGESSSRSPETQEIPMQVMGVGVSRPQSRVSMVSTRSTVAEPGTSGMGQSRNTSYRTTTL